MKTIKRSFKISGVAILLIVLTANLNGQIKVFDNGNVGIKYTTSTPLSKLVLNSPGVSNFDVYFYSGNRSSNGGAFSTLIETGTGSSNHIYGITGGANLGANNFLYGVRGGVTNSSALTVGRSYGVYGIAGNASAGYNYGVYGYLYGSNNGAAVFGTSTGDVSIPGKYAGYFSGNVHITGALWAYDITESDEKIKTNITPLKSSDSYDKIASLNPVKYNLKQREIVTADSSVVKNYYDPDSEFFKKPKYGFIAQELRAIYPDLIYESEDGTLGIDYTGMIPIMVSIIQEQKKEIDMLRKRIEALESE